MRLFKIISIALLSASVVVTQSDSFAAGKKSHKSHARKNKRQAGIGDVWERVRLGLRIPVLGPTYEGIDLILHPPRNLSPSTTGSLKNAASVGSEENSAPRLTTVIESKKLIKGESQLLEKFRSRHTLIPKSQEVTNTSDRYTRLGQLKLGSKLAPSSGAIPVTKQSQLSTNDRSSLIRREVLYKSPTMQRIRTRLGLNPDLSKQNGASFDTGTQNAVSDKSKNETTALAQNQFGLKSCADLTQKEVRALAQQGFLPDRYRQLAEDCRVRRSAIFERVNRQIAGFANSGFLNQSTERARPYLYHIVDALSKFGLPYDLALLPIVESGYQATALSPASAAGIWQFIPSTGRDYGLEQNQNYDGRLDVTAATHAAIRFLSGLRDRYHGDWLLALAAYNCGPGNVDAAIARNQAEGLDTDYWSLNLPAETQDYVPRLLALSTIFANPGRYGLKLRTIKNEPYFIKVAIDRQQDIDQLADKDLSTVAKLANFDSQEFRSLNAAYLKPTITHSKPFTLLMPISNANQLHQSLAFLSQPYDSKNVESTVTSGLGINIKPIRWYQVNTPLLSIGLNEEQSGILNKPKSFEIKGKQEITTVDNNRWSVHYLEYGESLKTVAENNGISEQKLREVNKIKRRQTISFGQRLFIPLKEFAFSSSNKKSSSILFDKVNTDTSYLHLRLW